MTNLTYREKKLLLEVLKQEIINCEHAPNIFRIEYLNSLINLKNKIEISL
jgi:hypothetical protein